MTNTLAICPSRGRPEGALRLLNAHRQMSSTWTSLVFVLDEDDACRYDAEVRDLSIILPRTYAAAKWTEAWTRRGTEFDACAILADDVEILTPEWDLILGEQIEQRNGWCVAWGNDGRFHDRFPLHPIIGGELIRAAGFAPIPVSHAITHAWKLIAKDLDCAAYLHDVSMPHRRWDNIKGKPDATWMQVATDCHEHDRCAIRRWKCAHREETARRLIALRETQMTVCN